jgi:hypothetical protein
MPAVTSPVTVVYRCPQVAQGGGQVWMPGDYFVQLLASAGPQCCLGQALLDSRPIFYIGGVVTVTWIPAIGTTTSVSCADASVDVVFIVTTDFPSGRTIGVPNSIQASDSGRTCTLKSPSQNTGCKLQECAGLVYVLLPACWQA